MIPCGDLLSPRPSVAGASPPGGRMRSPLLSVSSVLLLLVSLFSITSAFNSIEYTNVEPAAYFWPNEPLLVTISAQNFDLLVTNNLAGDLSASLSGVDLAVVPAGQTVYFEPNNAQGWIALNASFVLTDHNTNATLGATSTIFSSPPGWVANLTVGGSPSQMTVSVSFIPPPLYCAFSDPSGSTKFSDLKPTSDQSVPGPQLFLCLIEFYPDVIPVGSLFTFGVVLLPQNVPVNGPPIIFKSGAVWTSVNSMTTLCDSREVQIEVGGFWNVSEEYQLKWQPQGSTDTLTGPYSKPSAEAALTLRTGQALKNNAVIVGIFPRSNPTYPTPSSGVNTPYPLAASQSCRNPNRGAVVAVICLAVFLFLVVVFGTFFWYYRRFIGHDLLEQVSLLGRKSAPSPVI